MEIQLFDFSEIIKSIPHIRTDGGIDFLQAVDLGGVFAVTKPACYAFGLDFILDGDFGKELSEPVCVAVIGIIPKRFRRIGTPRRVSLCLII